MNQEARYAEQLEVAEKQAYDSQTKANDLSYQISELERNLTAKIWNVERTYRNASEALDNNFLHIKWPVNNREMSYSTLSIYV